MKEGLVKLKVREARLTDDQLILVGKGFERSVRVEDIRRVGVEKSFNKVLALLTIAVAVLTMISQDLPHLITLLLVLFLTASYREESIVLETKDDVVIKVAGLQSKDVRKTVNALLNRGSAS